MDAPTDGPASKISGVSPRPRRWAATASPTGPAPIIATGKDVLFIVQSLLSRNVSLVILIDGLTTKRTHGVSLRNVVKESAMRQHARQLMSTLRILCSQKATCCMVFWNAHAHRMRNGMDTRRKWLQTVFSAVVLSVRVWHFHPVESRASVVTRMASQAILHDTACVLSPRCASRGSCGCLVSLDTR